jgi:hypothetical protein
LIECSDNIDIHEHASSPLTCPIPYHFPEPSQPLSSLPVVALDTVSPYQRIPKKKRGVI